MTPQPVKPRVLIVDDRLANLVAYESILDREYSLSLAGNGSEALELARRGEYAVILLDVRMPGLNGYETAEALQKLETARYTPIIFMSAYDKDVIEVKRCYVAGGTDFISSPVDEDLLRFKVAAYARIFLRNESLRLQICTMANLVQSLQAEINRHTPTEEVFRARVQQLESAIEELRREMSVSA